MAEPTLDDLRRYAVARSLFKATTLPQAIRRLGFVQADPIRAPARAQDLTLRHRVKGYLAGDLERRYATLGVEEDTFRAMSRVRSLPPEHAKGLEFDLVVLIDPDAFGKGTVGTGIEGTVDRYVAMTRATQQLVILTST